MLVLTALKVKQANTDFIPNLTGSQCIRWSRTWSEFVVGYAALLELKVAFCKSLAGLIELTILATRK